LESSNPNFTFIKITPILSFLVNDAQWLLSCCLQDAAVKQIDVPSFSGSFGILPNHVPSLAVLRPGVVTVFENDGAVKKVIIQPLCARLGKQ
jgi:hypothetical protein